MDETKDGKLLLTKTPEQDAEDITLIQVVTTRNGFECSRAEARRLWQLYSLATNQLLPWAVVPRNVLILWDAIKPFIVERPL